MKESMQRKPLKQMNLNQSNLHEHINPLEIIENYKSHRFMIQSLENMFYDLTRELTTRKAQVNSLKSYICLFTPINPQSKNYSLKSMSIQVENNQNQFNEFQKGF